MQVPILVDGLDGMAIPQITQGPFLVRGPNIKNEKDCVLEGNLKIGGWGVDPKDTSSQNKFLLITA